MTGLEVRQRVRGILTATRKTKFSYPVLAAIVFQQAQDTLSPCQINRVQQSVYQLLGQGDLSASQADRVITHSQSLVYRLSHLINSTKSDWTVLGLARRLKTGTDQIRDRLSYLAKNPRSDRPSRQTLEARVTDWPWRTKRPIKPPVAHRRTTMVRRLELLINKLYQKSKTRNRFKQITYRELAERLGHQNVGSVAVCARKMVKQGLLPPDALERIIIRRKGNRLGNYDPDSLPSRLERFLKRTRRVWTIRELSEHFNRSSAEINVAFFRLVKTDRLPQVAIARVKKRKKIPRERP